MSHITFPRSGAARPEVSQGAHAGHLHTERDRAAEVMLRLDTVGYGKIETLATAFTVSDNAVEHVAPRISSQKRRTAVESSIRCLAGRGHAQLFPL